MSFGIDSSGNYGYIKAGADSVTPFKSGSGLFFTAKGGISYKASSAARPTIIFPFYGAASQQNNGSNAIINFPSSNKVSISINITSVYGISTLSISLRKGYSTISSISVSAKGEYKLSGNNVDNLYLEGDTTGSKSFTINGYIE